MACGQSSGDLRNPHGGLLLTGLGLEYGQGVHGDDIYTYVLPLVEMPALAINVTQRDINTCAILKPKVTPADQQVILLAFMGQAVTLLLVRE